MRMEEIIGEATLLSYDKNIQGDNFRQTPKEWEITQFLPNFHSIAFDSNRQLPMIHDKRHATFAFDWQDWRV